MANGCSNLRHDVSNYVQHPPHINTGQIACRLCNRIFISTQALIAHIESHMEHEEVAIRRLYSPEHINSQRPLAPPAHRFPPSFSVPIDTQNITDGRIFQTPPPQPMTIPQPRRNPFFSAGRVGSSQPVRQMQLPPQVLSSAGNNNNNYYNNVAGLLAQLPPPQLHQWKQPEEESPNDGTKAFIMQLEKPIKKIDFIDLVNIDDDNSDVQTLDLALKL